jgi:hypothetical protein
MSAAVPLPPAGGASPPARPWMTLYGARVGGTADEDEASTSSAAPPPLPLAPIASLLPECLVLIFGRLPPASLGAAACTCRAWRALITETDGLWRAALRAALGPAAPPRLPGVSWRETFLASPRLRTDGLYVSRNTYVRTGLTEWKFKNPVHLVTYFRYWRFFEPPVCGGGDGSGDGSGEGGSGGGVAAAGPSSSAALLASDAALPRPPPPARCARGAFWYRTTPDPPVKAARSLAVGPARGSGGSGDAGRVMEGRWRLRVPTTARASSTSPSSSSSARPVAVIAAAMAYDNTAQTEVRARLALRSTTHGACNRLDVLDLVSHDRATGAEHSMLGGGEETDGEEGWVRGGGGGGGRGGQQARGGGPPHAPPPPGTLQHRRGLATFVFIPWADIAKSPLNLPLSEMDCFIPG